LSVAASAPTLIPLGKSLSRSVGERLSSCSADQVKHSPGDCWAGSDGSRGPEFAVGVRGCLGAGPHLCPREGPPVRGCMSGQVPQRAGGEVRSCGAVRWGPQNDV